MKLFKFFEGQIKKERVFTDYMDRMDDYFLGGITEPPYGLSRRHWNILPEDIKRMSSVEMNAYIEGWETTNIGNVINPYPDDFRLGNLWTRGWIRRQNRV